MFADGIAAMTDVFIVHHNPNNGRYRYAGDPTDAVASAQALLASGAGTWVAGNCRRMLRPGSLLLFKFGGARLQQPPGIYAASHVTTAPSKNAAGTWTFEYKPDRRLTRHLLRFPVVGKDLGRVAPRSFGASIQVVRERGRAVIAGHLGDRAKHEPVRVGGGIRAKHEPVRVSGGIRAKHEPVRVGGDITHGLLILKEHLDRILAGTKTWEIRGKATARRGHVALIESKSGEVVGVCEIVDVVGPLSLAELQRNARRVGFRADHLHYETTFAWTLSDARRLRRPIPYRHPQGAVIWVRLEPTVIRRLKRERSDA